MKGLKEEKTLKKHLNLSQPALDKLAGVFFFLILKL